MESKGAFMSKEEFELRSHKIIETENLLIEPFGEKHLSERYVKWLNDPDVVRFSRHRHKKHTLESCKKYLEEFKDSPHFLWAINLKENSEHIGNINAYIDEINQTADIGIMIGENRFQHKGYGAEAWKAVCDFLLKNKKIRKISAGALATNVNMIRIMKKTGMQEDGRRIRHHIWEGQEVDIIHMAIFKEAEKKEKN